MSYASDVAKVSASHVLWASILAAAAVSVVTTLLVEYLAKPWLELRKDRILEADQRRREVLRGLRQANFLAFRIFALRNVDNAVVHGMVARLAAEAEPLVSAAVREEMNVPAALRED